MENSTPKKVFLLQEIIPSYRVPVFKRLAELEGVDLTVFYSDPTAAMRGENLKNADTLDGFRSVKLVRQTLLSRSYQFGILAKVLSQRPQVVIASNEANADRLLLLLLCKLLGIRMLWFFGGVHFKDPEKIREYTNQGRLNRWLGKANPLRWLPRLADGLVVYSAHARDYYIVLGYDPRTIWVAPNSTDTDALQEHRHYWLARQNEIDALKQRLSPNGEKVLFLLGRLNPYRKAGLLLQALDSLRKQGLQASLVIVGDGGERPALEKQVAELQLTNVFFEGAIYDDKELAKYFLASDIYVCPGAATLALKMAMCFGKPVIVGEFGLEIHDIDEGVNGFVIPLDDLDALTEKLRQLLQSEELIVRLGQGGLATIRDRINIQRMIEGFRQAIFNRLNTTIDTTNRTQG